MIKTLIAIMALATAVNALWRPISIEATITGTNHVYTLHGEYEVQGAHMVVRKIVV